MTRLVELFRALAIYLPVIFWTTDEDLFLTSAASSSGLPLTVALTLIRVDGRERLNIDDFWHPSVSAHLRARAGEAVSWRARTPRPITACTIPFLNEHGALVGVAGIALDQCAPRADSPARGSGALAGGSGTPECGTPEIGAMTARVLERLAGGESNTEISAGLFLSRQGLDYHLSVLRRKLDVTSRGAIVARAYSLNMFESGSWPPRLRGNRAISQ